MTFFFFRRIGLIAGCLESLSYVEVNWLCKSGRRANVIHCIVMFSRHDCSADLYRLHDFEEKVGLHFCKIIVRIDIGGDIGPFKSLYLFAKSE